MFLQLEWSNQLAIKARIFQNDGATCHYWRPVRDHLNVIYPERKIARTGPINWSPRSPDLNPVDFLFGIFTRK